MGKLYLQKEFTDNEVFKFKQLKVDWETFQLRLQATKITRNFFLKLKLFLQ